MCICVYVHIDIYVYMYVHIYIYSYTYVIWKNTYIYIYIHTHKNHEGFQLSSSLCEGDTNLLMEKIGDRGASGVQTPPTEPAPTTWYAPSEQSALTLCVWIDMLCVCVSVREYIYTYERVDAYVYIHIHVAKYIHSHVVRDDREVRTAIVCMQICYMRAYVYIQVQVYGYIRICI